MQLSSVSDFDIFSKRLKEHISTTVKEDERKASEYVLESKKNAMEDIEKYSISANLEWKREYKERQSQELKNIKSTISREWNSFKQERQNILYIKLRESLKEIFPTLAKSFIDCISTKYDNGTFIFAKPYFEFLKTEKFDLLESNNEKIIFKNENLYIEYSVERIMEELRNDITLSMNFEEYQWQE